MNGSRNHPVEISARKRVPPLRRALMIAVAAACAAGVSQAQAEVACDAPWMHQGGGFTTTSSPSQRTTVFTVTQFSKRDGNNCNGQIRAVMNMSMGGQPVQSESNIKFEIADGKVQAQTEAASGSMNSHAGAGTFGATVSSQTVGVLSYVGEITSDGQRIPGTRSEGSMSGKLANMGQAVGTMAVPKFVTTTSDKLVGKQEQLQTPAGKFACWPVTYDRSMHADNVKAMSRTVNLNAQTHVVDHFCPAAGLVMRQDMTTNGKPTSLTVSALH
ncbi:hypothetical protein [Paraburkholderia susongensis]|uniref:Uncharacterized protein n=1 Tax=Paraburkholderia susongensis TaxID=1515439 RepID=A0A1X7LT60_9BURK|nr:hypothetical protein [Paraburkholderia susongensis]SMG57061.1 hypothetical protein SAMN06265784_10964 [Paraburkholderia susongensis]